MVEICYECNYVNNGSGVYFAVWRRNWALNVTNVIVTYLQVYHTDCVHYFILKAL